MDGKPGLQNPGAGEEGKITRRQLVAGVVVLGGLGVLAYLYGDRLGMGCDCTCDLFTSKPPTTTPQTSTPSTSTSLAADLIGPDFPVHDIRPYLAIKPVGLTHMGAGADILDVFLANDGYGPSMAFFEIYKWHSLPRTGTPTITAYSAGKPRQVYAAESDMFPFTFPNSQCEFVSREMVSLPPGSNAPRRISIDRSYMDGVWLILYDPLLDPARFTIDNADYLSSVDGRRKYLYAGV